MPKTLRSAIRDFPGEIVLPDSLILPQVLAWNDMLIERDLIAQGIDREKTRTLSQNRKLIGQLDSVYLPRVFDVVLEWKIKNIPEKPTLETFPMTPRLPSTQFIAWIVGEIQRLYDGEIEIPNA